MRKIRLLQNIREKGFEHSPLSLFESETKSSQGEGDITFMPRDVFYHIIEYLSPYPHYPKLKRVCKQWFFEMHHVVCPAVTELDLVPREWGIQCIQRERQILQECFEKTRSRVVSNLKRFQEKYSFERKATKVEGSAKNAFQNAFAFCLQLSQHHFPNVQKLIISKQSFPENSAAIPPLSNEYTDILIRTALLHFRKATEVVLLDLRGEYTRISNSSSILSWATNSTSDQFEESHYMSITGNDKNGTEGWMKRLKKITVVGSSCTNNDISRILDSFPNVHLEFQHCLTERRGYESDRVKIHSSSQDLSSHYNAFNHAIDFAKCLQQQYRIPPFIIYYNKKLLIHRCFGELDSELLELLLEDTAFIPNTYEFFQAVRNAFTQQHVEFLIRVIKVMAIRNSQKLPEERIQLDGSTESSSFIFNSIIAGGLDAKKKKEVLQIILKELKFKVGMCGENPVSVLITCETITDLDSFRDILEFLLSIDGCQDLLSRGNEYGSLVLDWQTNSVPSNYLPLHNIVRVEHANTEFLVTKVIPYLAKNHGVDINTLAHSGHSVFHIALRNSRLADILMSSSTSPYILSKLSKKALFMRDGYGGETIFTAHSFRPPKSVPNLPSFIQWITKFRPDVSLEELFELASQPQNGRGASIWQLYIDKESWDFLSLKMSVHKGLVPWKTEGGLSFMTFLKTSGWHSAMRYIEFGRSHGLEVELVDEEGNNVFHYCDLWNIFRTIKALWTSRQQEALEITNMLFQENKDGRTPIEMFFEKPKFWEDVTQAPLLVQQIMNKRYKGTVPILNILVRNRPKICLCLMSRILSQTACGNMRDSQSLGKPTALHEAILRRDLKLVKLMVQSNSLGAKDSLFDLSLALEDNQEHRIQPFKMDCLYLACMVGDIDIFQFISHYVSPQDNFDPVAIALEYGWASFALELIRKHEGQLPPHFINGHRGYERMAWMNLLSTALRDSGPKYDEYLANAFDTMIYPKDWLNLLIKPCSTHLSYQRKKERHLKYLENSQAEGTTEKKESEKVVSGILLGNRMNRLNLICALGGERLFKMAVDCLHYHDAFNHAFCAKYSFGNTPLHYICSTVETENWRRDQELFGCHKEITQRSQELKSIAAREKLKMLQYLLSCYSGSNLVRSMFDIQNDDGNTALHIAAMYGLTDVCKLLLREGASRTVVNRAGRKPLDYIGTTDHALEVLELLDVEESEQRNCMEVVSTTTKPQKIQTVQTEQNENRVRRKKRLVKRSQKRKKRHKSRR